VHEIENVSKKKVLSSRIIAAQYKTVFKKNYSRFYFKINARSEYFDEDIKSVRNTF